MKDKKMTKRNHKKEENIKDVNAFMHEVEEAMHAETMLNFWNSYKVFLVALLAAAFVAVTSWQWYSTTVEKGLVHQADNLWAVERNMDSNAESYTDLLQNGSKGYKVFAMFKTAQKLLEAGELNAANIIYDDIINSKESNDFKELAMFYKGVSLVSANTEKASALFVEVVATEGAFVMSAQEMLGIIAEQKGDITKAKQYYENIIVNPTISKNLRDRVQSRLDFINRQSKNA